MQNTVDDDQSVRADLDAATDDCNDPQLTQAANELLETLTESPSNGELPESQRDTPSNGELSETHAESPSNGELPETQAESSSNGELPETQAESPSNGVLPTETQGDPSNNGELPAYQGDSPSNEQLPETQSESPSNGVLSLEMQGEAQWQSIFNSHPSAKFEQSLRILRRQLPNLRHCHGNGRASVYATCDPFQIDDATADLLLQQLQLRSIIDLRWGPERREAFADSPLCRRLNQQQLYECLPAADLTSQLQQHEQHQQQQQQQAPTLFRVDFLRCPQRELEQFLGDCPARLDSSDIGAIAAAAYEQRQPVQASLDVADFLRSGVAAVFRILASSSARPALLVCPDGVTRCSVIACVLRLLARDEQSLMIEHMADARMRIDEANSSSSSSSSKEQGQLEAVAGAQQLVHHFQQKYVQPENYLLTCGLTMQQLRQLKTLYDNAIHDY